MAACASLVFTLMLCACVHTLVECDSSCSNKLDCTIYTIQEVGRKVDHVQSNMGAVVNQLKQIQDADIALKEVFQKLEMMNATILNQSLETSGLKDTILNQSQQLLSQNLEISGLKEQITNLNQVVQINDELSGSYVSFTAYATVERSYNALDHVLFKGIVRNYGASYFPKNSTFVCPFDGYYLFSASILAAPGTFEAWLMLNDEILLIPFARDDVTYAAASGLVVTQCSAGQKLWIMAGTNGRLSGNSNRHSTFSVTLLKLA